MSRALPRRAGAGARHRSRVGRDDQVRVERVPRHEDLVHQRDREPLRGGRRRRPRGRDRHGLRRAHRVPVPAPRARATAVRASRRTSPRCCTPRATAGYDFELLAGVVDVNRGAARADGRQGRAPRSAARSTGADRRRLGPHVQGRHRRPARLAGARRSRGGLLDEGADRAGVRPGGGRAGAADWCRGSTSVPIAYDAAAGADVVALLTEWDEFRWLDFDRVARRDAPAARSSTPATCSIRRRCAGAASPTTASGADDGRIVVTGGAGFLGSHLCDAFLARGDEVVAVDNLSTGRRENVDAPRRRTRASSSSSPTSSHEIPVDGRGRRRAALREPGEPARVPRDAARDARRRLARHAPRARPRARERRAVPARVDERDLRRPARAPAARGLPRQRRPDRAARGLRRGEAVRARR